MIKSIAGRGTESLPNGTSNGGNGNKSKIIGEVLELGQSWILDCSQKPKAVRLYMNHPPGDSIRDLVYPPIVEGH